MARNFPELRKELEARGHKFYTHTDTEVIVHLYQDLGPDCVIKLRGMFALVPYDENRETLLLARDRVGRKPRYYAANDSRLYFGSEIEAILAVAPQLAAGNSTGAASPTRIPLPIPPGDFGNRVRLLLRRECG